MLSEIVASNLLLDQGLNPATKPRHNRRVNPAVHLAERIAGVDEAVGRADFFERLAQRHCAANNRRTLDVHFRTHDRIIPRAAHGRVEVEQPIVQISTDGFAAYPEAVDLAFGPYVRYGTITKEYRNAKIVYTPSEMVGTRRTGIRGIKGREQRTICTSHVERLNGTQRVFLKRLNRLTLCFSKKLRNLEAAFAMFAAYYNYCWQTRKPGKSGTNRPTAAMMAGLSGHVWSFDELFDLVLAEAAQ